MQRQNTEDGKEILNENKKKGVKNSPTFDSAPTEFRKRNCREKKEEHEEEEEEEEKGGLLLRNHCWNREGTIAIDDDDRWMH